MKQATTILTLVLLALLTGCQHEGIMTEPEVDMVEAAPEMQSTQVKVHMGLCIPPRFTAPETRMSAEVTQAAGDAASFRGIGAMSLLAFDGLTLPTGASQLKVAPLDLGGVSKGELTSMKNYKFYEDKPLNVGVSHAVVYGEAAPAEGGDAANGVLRCFVAGAESGSSMPTDITTSNHLSDVTFSLKNITDNNLTEHKAKLAHIINDIIGASIKVEYYFTLNNAGTAVEKKEEAGGTTLLWKNFVGTQPIGEESEQIDLDDERLYTLFQSLKELKSGSAASILETVKSLYRVLGTYTMGTHAIQWKGDAGIGYSIKSCDVDAEADAGYTKLVIDRTDMKTAIIDKIQTHFTVSNDQVVGYNESGEYYPGAVTIPDGALPIIYNVGTKYFTYEDAGAILPSDRLKTTSICYPASLFYTVNSRIRTRKTELHDADKLQVNTAAAWSNAILAGGLWGSDKTGADREWQTSVQNDTRTIVLTENIHYGVALLETSVRVATPTLQDNNKKNDGVTPDPNLLAVPAAGFPITGILIGAQPDKVGWDLHAATVSNGYDVGTTNYTQTIYDNAAYSPVSGTYPVSARYSTSVFSEPLRTLCLESQAWGEKDGSGNRPSALYVALELKNTTGMSFVGADGIVPAGGTFYLLAKLDLEIDAANGITNVSGSGIGTTLTHVLQQGYKTHARLTIASLKNAYNTIPDLRLTKLAFGLSVDLMWQQGAVFNIGG